MKILFVQLPLSDRGNNFASGNYPYGPYAVVRYLEKKYPGGFSAHVMDPLFVNTMNDAVIAREALSYGADIVSFSVFAWNAERSLRIAEYIADSSDARIIFGGPEISHGSFLFAEKRGAVSEFVQGEGEWYFDLLLSGGDADAFTRELNGNRLVSQPDDGIIPQCDIAEPYGEGVLPYIKGTYAFAEITRGCPWRCSYCMYSRRTKTVREQPDDILVRAVKRAVKDSASGLYVLSPSLHTGGQGGKRLGILAAMRHGIPLHSEMRTEHVDDAAAETLFNAGFRSMEVGLQTMNPAAIAKIGRKSDPEKEINGMNILNDHGIGLKIGLIPGLPGDTPEEFRRTVDVLASRGLAESAEAYPLMVLPGTAIRDSAAAENLRYMDKPPYFFLESSVFSHETIRDMRTYLESASGESSCTNEMPRPAADDASISGGVIIDCSRPFDRELLDANMPETHSVTVKLFSADPSAIVSVVEQVCSVYDRDFALISFILMSDRNFPDRKLSGYVKSIEGDSYFRRSRLYHDEKDAFRIRFYQIINSPECYLDAAGGYDFINALLVYNESNAMALKAEEWPFQPDIFIPEGEYHPQKEYFDCYGDNPDMVCFESYTDLSVFYKHYNLVLPESVYGHKLVRIN